MIAVVSEVSEGQDTRTRSAGQRTENTGTDGQSTWILREKDSHLIISHIVLLLLLLRLIISCN